jgi:hypothetical protein
LVVFHTVGLLLLQDLVSQLQVVALLLSFFQVAAKSHYLFLLRLFVVLHRQHLPALFLELRLFPEVVLLQGEYPLLKFLYVELPLVEQLFVLVPFELGGRLYFLQRQSSVELNAFYLFL